MKNQKNFAGWMAVAIFCAAFVFPCMLTSCENGYLDEVGLQPLPPTPGDTTTIVVRDTVWVTVPADTVTITLPGDTITVIIPGDTITVKDTVVIDRPIGLQPDGNPSLNYITEEIYETLYPVIIDGENTKLRTDLNVWARGEEGQGIIVVKDSVLSYPKYDISRQYKSHVDGEFLKTGITTGWGFQWAKENFKLNVTTMHEIAKWANYFQMLYGTWSVRFVEVIYGEGMDYNHEGVDGRLFENTFVFEAIYSEPTTGVEDIREIRLSQKFFMAIDRVSVEKQYGKDFGFDYVNDNTSYTYMTLVNKMDDGSIVEVGKIGVNVFNSIETPAGQIIDRESFEKVDNAAVQGQKQYVSERTEGEFLIKKYKTSYTTSTNITEVVFVAYHEEAEYISSVEGNGNIAMNFKEYSFIDNGSSDYSDLSKENGKSRKEYFSRIQANYNGHSADHEVRIEVRVKTPNKYGIDMSKGDACHVWDANSVHYVTISAVYNIDKEGAEGGIVVKINGNVVAKADWNEVAKPKDGQRIAAAQRNGVWTICYAERNADGKGWTFRSMMKENYGRAVRGIENNQILIIDPKTTDVLIPSSKTENADETVTVNAGQWGSATFAAFGE